MKQVTKTSLGFEVPVWVYESPEEADTAAGRQGALLEEANNNLYYRAGAAGESREVIAAKVEALTGIPRKSQVVTKKNDAGEEEVVKDSDGNEVSEFTETEEVYVKRALAEAKLTPAAIQADITAALNAANEGQGIRVDIKKKERKPAAPKKLADRFLQSAKSVIDAGKVKSVAKEYQKRFGKSLEEGADTDPVKLGWAIKDILAHREAEQLTQFTA